MSASPLRICLLNPDTDRRKTLGWLHRFASAIPPLNLACLAAVARQEGHEPRIFDQYGTREDDGRMVRRIAAYGADVLGISALTPTMRRARWIMRAIREARPETLIVLGNVHPSMFPDATLHEGLADVVVKGEGEETFREILQRRAGGESVAGVPGTLVRVGEDIVRGPLRPEMRDLNSNPFPSWEDADLSLYGGALLLGVRERILPIQQSRGCAYRCSFCGQESMHDNVRRRDVRRVVDEIEYLNRRFGTSCVGFLDAYFPVTKRDGLAFCEEMLRRGTHRRVRWITETRVDKVDRELLSAMRKAGCCTIMYGFEVGDQDVLTSIDKGTTIAQNLQAMAWTRELGIVTLGLFIIGLPGETPATIEATIQHAIKLDCDIAKFNIATPLPGSRFFNDLVKERPELHDADPEKFSSWFDGGDDEGILYAPRGMTAGHVQALQRHAMRRFYARPRMILRHVVRGTIPAGALALGGAAIVRNAMRGPGPAR